MWMREILRRLRMKKNFKSTKSLYGVEPKHFENMKYFEALQEKRCLAAKRIKEVVEKLDCKMPYEEYVTLNTQLRMCEKAFRFNTELIEESKKMKKGVENEGD